MVKNGLCPWCTISPNDIPCFPCRSRCCSSLQYLHWLTTAVEEMGLWIFTNCLNSADALAGCNIYHCMNVDQLYQQLNSLVKELIWVLVVCFPKNIYGKMKGLYLIDEQFSIIPRFSNICEFGDKGTHLTHWTGVWYKDKVKVWLPALAPLFNGHPDYFLYIQFVIDFILITSYHCHIETMIKYLKMCFRLLEAI